MANQDSITDPFGFAKRMWGNMGLSLPGMVTPTFNVDEIEQKIKDLKAVENWLKMNLSMLQMTIQGLEMQCVTLNAVRAMGKMASSYGTTGTGSDVLPAPTSGGNEALKQAALWPLTLLQQMQEQMQQVASAAAEAKKAAETTNADDPSKPAGKP